MLSYKASKAHHKSKKERASAVSAYIYLNRNKWLQWRPVKLIINYRRGSSAASDYMYPSLKQKQPANIWPVWPVAPQTMTSFPSPPMDKKRAELCGITLLISLTFSFFHCCSRNAMTSFVDSQQTFLEHLLLIWKCAPVNFYRHFLNLTKRWQPTDFLTFSAITSIVSGIGFQSLILSSDRTRSSS